MKKTIIWITSDNFLDTNIQIVPKIAEIFNVRWFVIFTKTRNKKYSQRDIENICSGKCIDLRFYNLTHRQRSLNSFGKFIKLINEVRSLDCDIVYGNVSQSHFYYHIVAALILNKSKYICAIHDVVMHSNIVNGFCVSIVNKMIFKLFANFQLFSRSQKELADARVPKKNTFYINLSLYDFGKPKISTNKNNKTTFLFFGQIRRHKGLEYLIEAGNLLYEKKPDEFIIKIAGQCDDWNFYERKIVHKNAFDLRIGYIESEEVPGLFGCADFLVLPYLDVTQSGPLMIAFNYGIPVIASDLPGFKDYSEGVCNFFRPGDIDELHNALLNALSLNGENYLKIKKTLELNVKNNFTPDSVAKKYLKLFNEFTNGCS
ncbi:MAG: glycosyltransferase [Chitinispirillaceae bacterium]|nr:glycosyltransferase [Chitinispirillaceae bacterium]